MEPDYQGAMESSSEASHTQDFHGERRRKTASSSLLNTVSWEVELREDVCGIKNVSVASSSAPHEHRNGPASSSCVPEHPQEHRNGPASSSSVPEHPQEDYSPPPKKIKLSEEEQAEANRKKSSEYRKNKAIEYKNKEDEKNELEKIFCDNEVEMKQFEMYLQKNNKGENGQYMRNINSSPPNNISITDMEDNLILNKAFNFNPKHYVNNIFSEANDEPSTRQSKDDHTGDANVPTTSKADHQVENNAGNSSEVGERNSTVLLKDMKKQRNRASAKKSRENKKEKNKKLDNDIKCLRKKIAEQYMILSMYGGLCMSAANENSQSCSCNSNQDADDILFLSLPQSSMNDAPVQPGAQATERDQSTMTSISNQQIAQLLLQQDQSTMTDAPVAQLFFQPTAKQDQSTMTDAPVVQLFIHPITQQDQSAMTGATAVQLFLQPTAQQNQSITVDAPVPQSIVQPTAKQNQSITVDAPVPQSSVQPTAKQNQSITVDAPVPQSIVQPTDKQNQSITVDAPVPQSSVQPTAQQDQSAMNQNHDLFEHDSEDIYNCFE